MRIIENIFNKAKSINSQGAVTLYLMRYRKKSTGKGKDKTTVDFPYFYDAKLEDVLQEKFVKLFTDAAKYYPDETYDYTVNGSHEDGIAVVDKDDFENVTNFINDLEQGTNVSDNMSELKVNQIKAYIVKLSFGNDDNLYFFGNIKNYSELQKKAVIVRKATNNTKLKEFDLDNTIGFDFFVNMFWYNDKLYIANSNKFESVFKMASYYKEQAGDILNTIVRSNVVIKEDIEAINKKCQLDSRIAKKVMKLKFRKDRIESIYKNLNQNIFDEITKDDDLEDKYSLLKYTNNKLTMSDNSDLKNIHEYLNFIADTAKRGIASRKTSSENF